MFEKGKFAKINVMKVYFLGKNWGLFDLPIKKMYIDWEKLFLYWLFEKKNNEWEVFHLGPLDPNSIHVNSLLTYLNNEKISYKLINKSIPYLLLPTAWDEYLISKSRNFRRTIIKKEKFAFENGKLIKKRYVNPSANELQSSIFTVAQSSWQGKDGVAIASNENGQTFYNEIFSGNGEFDIDLSTIYTEKKCIAYLLGFIQGQKYYAFDTGFDPNYADYSPGLLCHFDVLRQLCWQ
jgi:hypothetical protein